KLDVAGSIPVSRSNIFIRVLGGSVLQHVPSRLRSSRDALIRLLTTPENSAGRLECLRVCTAGSF
ncbi:MAG TPA: hypothetical protein P5300_12290, partial [Acidobacteriota bacterium]|nr:hypothetical protein [Acidobacteriota bacterium]